MLRDIPEQLPQFFQNKLFQLAFPDEMAGAFPVLQILYVLAVFGTTVGTFVARSPLVFDGPCVVIQFTPTIGTIGHAGEQTGIAVAGGAALVFPHTANNVPRFQVDDSRVGMLKHKLLVGRVQAGAVVFVRL